MTHPNFQPGDHLVHLPDLKAFVLARRTRNRKTGAVMLWDESGKSYPIQDCAYDPDPILIMVGVARAMVRAGDYSDFELLEALPPEQKRQVWALLTLEEKQALKTAKQEVS